MIIGLFGLSGSGKSFLSNQFKKEFPYFYCCSASSLLRGLDRPITPDEIGTDDLRINQYSLKNGIKNLSTEYNFIFIELHAIIEYNVNETYIVPNNILQSLGLDQIYLLDPAADLIMKYRQNDTSKHRYSKTLEELESLRSLQKTVLLESFSDSLKVIKNISDISIKS